MAGSAPSCPLRAKWDNETYKKFRAIFMSHLPTGCYARGGWVGAGLAKDSFE